MDQLDAYRCAKIMLDRHGEDGFLQAALRADELGELGDEPGRRAWLAIIAAMDELRRTQRHLSEALQ